jgi:hypothetical protein
VNIEYTIEEKEKEGEETKDTEEEGEGGEGEEEEDGGEGKEEGEGGKERDQIVIICSIKAVYPEPEVQITSRILP